MLPINQLLTDLLGLLFPELCNACGTNLHKGEQQICLECLYSLPYTDYHLYPDNRVAKQFWGRIPVDAAMAMLYFRKGSKVQNLMHALKYNGRSEVGIELGKLLGTKLATSESFKNVDVVLPVPLHPKRLKRRGYNQSECIAAGLAEVYNVRLSTTDLIRKKSTETQTKKSRYTRFENMQTTFEVTEKDNLKNMHVLLVDDVVTTGATLEACGNVLLQSGINKLSIATVAFAE